MWLNRFRLCLAMGPSRSFNTFSPAVVMRTVMTRRSLLSRLRVSRPRRSRRSTKARNIRVARDHALRHLAAAEALLARAAQNAQHVVLGVRKPRQLQDLLRPRASASAVRIKFRNTSASRLSKGLPCLISSLSLGDMTS